jgi:GDP-D-mannose dehydratase
LGWTPTLSFEEMIHMMVEADLKRLSQAPGGFHQ